ncbi:hypothetical protein OnM2_028059 [Erysiphe neolycopersici]|uniref:FAR1 domain-containing protein n=1 Tax=Erysiphe neolycopersici TaxID=212602 RepID=A0A420I067_9PEZI|nr:hypothetical protein OnM2_028059 [Erysiphe neolycopersici]
MCDRRGKIQHRKNPNLHQLKQRLNTGSPRKTNCPFRIIAQEYTDKVGDEWKGYILEENHNHKSSDLPEPHPKNRMLAIDHNGDAKPPVQSLLDRKSWGIELISWDIYNMSQKVHRRTL